MGNSGHVERGDAIFSAAKGELLEEIFIPKTAASLHPQG